VVSICGDWGFQMFGQELATCVDERAGVVFAVMNDAGMRMVEAGFLRIYGRSPRFRGTCVDFAALARSVGARGVTVRTTADVLALDPAIGVDDVPTVLDVRIDPNASFPQPARADQIGSFTSADGEPGA
jgi:acetolactate synthase-1/2/3 large subunit